MATEIIGKKPLKKETKRHHASISIYDTQVQKWLALIQTHPALKAALAVSGNKEDGFVNAIRLGIRIARMAVEAGVKVTLKDDQLTVEI